MLKELPEDFRKFFLLEFTRQLIENSTGKYIYELKNIVEDEKKEEKEKFEEKQRLIHGELKEHEKEVKKQKKSAEKNIGREIKKTLKKEKSKPKKTSGLKQRLKSKSKPKRILKIPGTKLPRHLQYLKPEPKQDIQIDLEKINPLIQDPLVKEIQCDGPDENIIVKGVFGVKPTKIILSSHEIEEIINKFSEASKIPIEPGLFKVVAGKLIFTAIISEINPKFIITKMIYNPGFRG